MQVARNWRWPAVTAARSGKLARALRHCSAGDLLQERDAAIESLQDEKQSLVQLNDYLAEEKETLLDAQDERLKQIQRLENEAGQARSDCDALREELDAAAEDARCLQRQLSASQQAAGALKIEVDSLQTEVDSLKRVQARAASRGGGGPCDEQVSERVLGARSRAAVLQSPIEDALSVLRGERGRARERNGRDTARGVSSPAVDRGAGRRRREESVWGMGGRGGGSGADEKERLEARVEELEAQLLRSRRQLANVERASAEDEDMRERLAAKVKEIKLLREESAESIADARHQAAAAEKRLALSEQRLRECEQEREKAVGGKKHGISSSGGAGSVEDTQRLRQSVTQLEKSLADTCALLRQSEEARDRAEAKCKAAEAKSNAARDAQHGEQSAARARLKATQEELSRLRLAMDQIGGDAVKLNGFALQVSV